MVTDYTFYKYKDKYYLKNLGITFLNYILQVRDSCEDTYTSVSSGTISITQNDDEFSLGSQIVIPNDGDYQLLLVRGDDSETYLFTSYIRLQKAIINNFLTIICGTNNNCQGCENNPSSFREQQALFNQLLTYNFLAIEPTTQYCGGNCLFSGFVQKALDLTGCSLRGKVYRNLNKELQTGRTEIVDSLEITIIYASLYYMLYYLYEDLLSIDDEEKLYVKQKFNYDVAKVCMSKYISCLDDLRDLFEDVSVDCNEAPTVGSITKLFIQEDNDDTELIYDFVYEDFTTNFFDINGDSPEEVTIVTDTFRGRLYYNDSLVDIFPFIFNIANVDSLKYKYYITETSNNFDKIFFLISDNNLNPKNSNMGTITINTQAYVNLPPNEVGDNSFTIANRATKVFTLADFTTGTTPPYADPENDAVDALRIDSLPADGVLKLNGTNCTSGQIITAAQISGGLFTYTGPNQNAVDTDTWNFSLRDVGSMTFVS